MDLPIQWEGWKHHHWLLIRLAMKTGDVTNIWSAYGEGGLAGLMGLSEEVHSPDEHHFPRVGCILVEIYIFIFKRVSHSFFVLWFPRVHSFSRRFPRSHNQLLNQLLNLLHHR